MAVAVKWLEDGIPTEDGWEFAYTDHKVYIVPRGVHEHVHEKVVRATLIYRRKESDR